MKISLCLIAGNVEQYIVRCLESFAPAVDEIVVVRAIGNLAPDATMDRAIATAERLGVPLVTGTYQNAPEHDWPHVDDFAAARQLSFDLATGDYCLWADTDDVLAPGSAAKIRAHAARAEYAAYFFPYEVIGRGVTVPRERLVLKHSGRWVQPVHECFKFHVEPVAAAQDDTVLIQHMPEPTKTGSNDRNLRILESIPESELTTSLKFHLFCELLGVEKDRAVAFGLKLLESPELGKTERYGMLLELMLNTDNLNTRTALLHEAYKCDPTRREALGVLAGTAMDAGYGEDAIAYASQMLATPEPKNHVWNTRRSFFGHIGEDIYQQALRFNGRFSEAEARRQKHLAAAGRPIISLLHATRGRPKLASKARKLWFDLAKYPERLEHVFAFDSDDADSQVLGRMHSIVVPAGGGCVRAWNYAANASLGDVMIQMSDDFTPPMHWDALILERLGDLSQPRVLAVSDGHRQDQLLCLAICTRAYFAQDYFLFHPWFTGVYSDNWFTQCAYARQQVIEARDLVFLHNHPAFGTGTVDRTYLDQNHPEMYREGESIFQYLQTGRDWSSVPGYFNYWQFYQLVAAKVKDGDTLVEVGSWFGRSLIYLAQELQRLGKRNCKLIAVDTFKGDVNVAEHQSVVAQHGGSIRAAFEANLERCGVRDMVTIIEGDSAASASGVADGSVAFCYIDAAHDYESVKRDLAAWRGKVKPGGLLAGHDAQWHEVRHAVEELIPNAKFSGAVWKA